MMPQSKAAGELDKKPASSPNAWLKTDSITGFITAFRFPNCFGILAASRNNTFEHPNKIIRVVVSQLQGNLEVFQGVVAQQLGRLLHFQPEHIITHVRSGLHFKEAGHVNRMHIHMVRNGLQGNILRQMIPYEPFHPGHGSAPVAARCLFGA